MFVGTAMATMVNIGGWKSQELEQKGGILKQEQQKIPILTLSFFTFSLAMRKKKKNNREIAVYLSDKLKAVHPLLEFLLLSEMFHEVFCEIYIKM